MSSAATINSRQPAVRLIQGDCLKVMTTLPAGIVQMVFADLPYSITHHAYDVPVSLQDFAVQSRRLCAGAVVCTATLAFAAKLLAVYGKNFRHDLVWHKSRSTGFLTAKKMPMKAHEHVLVFAEKKILYNPQMVDAGKPCQFAPDSRVGRPVRVAPSSIVYKKNVTNFRYPTSVLAHKSVANRERLHPAQKPVSLLEWLIRTYTNEGDTVLDPVMGSGTTGVACLRTGRNFIGIEKDDTYFRVASERIAAEKQRLSA